MIKGLGTALITPFDANGVIDYKALTRLLDTQLTGFVDYIVVLGTTGEAATMSADEKREVRQFIVQYVKGRLPLVLGVGGNNTSAVCAELREMKEELEQNYAAILSVCPY
ncbi:MAG: dihydrodipicolinate synthase family protein, partial [Paludibacteraceae bacterium]|nr:dihydrodipicolinate synthase family protein [Paludibacteraceae bacterium]